MPFKVILMACDFEFAHMGQLIIKHWLHCCYCHDCLTPLLLEPHTGRVRKSLVPLSRPQDPPLTELREFQEAQGRARKKARRTRGPYNS